MDKHLHLCSLVHELAARSLAIQESEAVVLHQRHRFVPCEICALAEQPIEELLLSTHSKGLPFAVRIMQPMLVAPQAFWWFMTSD